jgi:hypothetical protein
MCLSDTAEYWSDIKSIKCPYNGKQFRHHPNYDCSHIKPITGNTDTTPYTDDINCFECIEAIKNGNTEGLISGKASETYYLSHSERKKYNKRKRFVEQHGICSCGRNWTIRKNKNTGEEFLGCISYPICKKTKRMVK